MNDKAMAADDPRMKAWKEYSATDDYANTRKWALHDAHVDGSLWAAFITGYAAAGRTEIGLPEIKPKGKVNIEVTSVSKLDPPEVDDDPLGPVNLSDEAGDVLTTSPEIDDEEVKSVDWEATVDLLHTKTREQQAIITEIHTALFGEPTNPKAVPRGNAVVAQIKHVCDRAELAERQLERIRKIAFEGGGTDYIAGKINTLIGEYQLPTTTGEEL